MATLPKRLTQMSESEIPTVTAEIAALLRRVFATGPLDGLETAAAENSLLDHVLGLIEAHLSVPDFSPALLAERAGTSRATLYRLFAPMGGIMRYVQERRLLAVKDVLSDPLDRRSLAQLVVAYGFNSQPVLSRGFRARFGMSPRDWRQKQADLDLAAREPSPEPMHMMWHDLGRAVRGP